MTQIDADGRRREEPLMVRAALAKSALIWCAKLRFLSLLCVSASPCESLHHPSVSIRVHPWFISLKAQWVLLASLLFVSMSSLAEAPSGRYPCTQYKAADIALAKKNIAEYPWAAKIYADLKQSADYYLGMSREEIRSFISPQTPFAAIKCPVCGEAPWSYYYLRENGSVLECVDCKTRWKWDPADTSETWNIPAVHRYYRLVSIMRGLPAAGLVYQIEGDRRLAEKAAVIIERLAEVFKGYRMNMIHRNKWLDRPDPYYAKIAGWKHREMDILRRTLLTYDLIHDSGVLTPAQIEKIDNDLVAYTRDYLIEGYGPGGPVSSRAMQDQGNSWWVLTACGALLGDQQTLDIMVDAFETVLDPANGIFYEDGSFFQGSAGYQWQFMFPISSIPDIISGNTERDIYNNPRCSLLEKCYTWTLDFVYPNGAIPSINDAHVGDTPEKRFAEIAYKRYGNKKALRYLSDLKAKATEEDYSLQRLFEPAELPADKGEPYGVDSVHFKGAGLMTLRHGADAASRTMAFLDYGAYKPPNQPEYHKHRDYLNIGLWACGVEMISEMGYAMTPPWVQEWQVSPMAHNTVLEAAVQKEGGRSLIWHITPGVQMAEAGLPPANSRFIALLPRAQGEPLIVDIFRVAGETGGYTWAMHGQSGDFLMRYAGDEMKSVEVEEPLRNGMAADVASGVIEALWRFAGPEPGPGPCGLKVLLSTQEGDKLITAECPPEEPEIKATHMPGGTLITNAVIPYRGHIQLKRAGSNVVFAAVHMPFPGKEEPSVTLTSEKLGEGEALALKIECGDESFIVIHNPGAASCEFSGVALDGRAGIASFFKGELKALSLAQGRSLKFGTEGVYRSTIGDSYRERRKGISHKEAQEAQER